ncbi:uncharacterized protein LOC134943488 isoform X2 [Pseudophryne corroboree]|uniref:uncharacterized protein LOC134943488 isoform X2 n=1 Tax=Pseudophryne corroboree TaxID=495146 RepID=UPI003081C77D
MDRLYASLREELQVFEEQVQKCRVNFDLQTLQRALALLLEEHKEQLDNWKHIEQYIQSTSNIGEQRAQLHKYFSWLLSYLEHLRAMKHAFDDHVVFPLCDNLYINDETETPPAPFLLSPPNITSTARQLFHHRRRWALLLSSGTLVQNHHSSGTPHSMALLHCIPDIFEESLVTANLAHNWIILHEARCKNPLTIFQQQPKPGGECQVEEHTAKRLFGSFLSSADLESQTQLKDMREHMMFLLWRAGRAKALEQQVSDSKLKVRSLQQDICELQQLHQKYGKETSGAQKNINLEDQTRLEKLQRQLNLEQFQQRILQCDWQLELEVKPLLIRQLNTLISA